MTSDVGGRTSVAGRAEAELWVVAWSASIRAWEAITIEGEGRRWWISFELSAQTSHKFARMSCGYKKLHGQAQARGGVPVSDQTFVMRTLSEFTRHLLAPRDAEEALTALAGYATEILGLWGTGVSLARGGELMAATVFPEQLAVLEQSQQDHQSGPCMTAFWEERIIALEDLGAYTERWPHYCRVAESIGVSSVASVPMHLRESRVGAVDLYGKGHRTWAEGDLAVAAAMADMATGYLLHVAVLQQQAELNAQLQNALVSRIPIEQAKGLLASKHGISLDQAFERLRGYAREHRETVRKVAEAVVDGVLTL
jgi:GAF domain-containing protein